jgi:hypothetical protein
VATLRNLAWWQQFLSARGRLARIARAALRPGASLEGGGYRPHEAREVIERERAKLEGAAVEIAATFATYFGDALVEVGSDWRVRVVFERPAAGPLSVGYEPDQGVTVAPEVAP